jgi:hypothetical protein
MLQNDITFSITYYGQVNHLQYQLDFFSALPEKLRTHISLQLINDGYNDSKLFIDICERYADVLDISAYEVTKDLGFNSHGCRNLMMMESSTKWNMLMDIDTYLSKQIVENMITLRLSDKKIYVFKVTFDHDDNPNDYQLWDPKELLKLIAHPNTWLITKPAFWSGGGYDIEFTGMRHGDEEFFLSLDHDLYEHVLFHPYLSEPSEIHIRRPNRNRSYLNQGTEHSGHLTRIVDFVKKRNEDKSRKHKKRLICFPWRKVV